MQEKENQHNPWHTFSTAISLPFINSIVIYVASKIDLAFFSGDHSYDPDGPFSVAIILIIFSLIPALIIALTVTLKFKPTNFSKDQNAFIWASMGIFTAIFVGFFSAGLTDMEGWFADGTGWNVLSYGLVGFCAGRYLVESKVTIHIRDDPSQPDHLFNRSIQPPHLADQTTSAKPPANFWWGILGLSVLNLGLILVLAFSKQLSTVIFFVNTMAIMLFVQFGLIVYLLSLKCFKQAGVSVALFIIFALIFYTIFSFAASSY